MKKTGKIGSILCLLALLGLTGIYALPKVYVLYQANTGKVDICLKEYMLEEGKEVPWKNGKDVLPGGFVSKIPRIRNDGAECYVRATVSFSSQKESEKPLSLENLEGISSDWVRDGDYFYYKHTVKPGEKVEFFQGIRIPWEWKTPDEDNVWKACVRAEAVQAEYFSPDFTGEDPWGMKVYTFPIQYAPEGDIQEQTADTEEVELLLAEQVQGFAVEQEGCMKTLETFVPGKSQMGSIRLKNTTEKEREVFFRAETQEQSVLLEKMELKVELLEKEENRILYQGSAAACTPKELQSLGKLAPQEEKQLRFTFSLAKDADNTYALQKGKIKFWFTTGEEETGKIATAVSTGDPQKPIGYLLTAVGAAIVLLFMVLGRKWPVRK